MESINYNYALEAGILSGSLSTLAYQLVRAGLVKNEDHDKVRDFCEKIIADARKKSKN